MAFIWFEVTFERLHLQLTGIARQLGSSSWRWLTISVRL